MVPKLPLLILAAWSILLSRADAQTWEQGVALLHNDRCVSGRIELGGDRLVLTKSEGHQFSVPRSQIQYVGSNLDDVYQFKRRALSPSARAGDHFKLAQWCLTNQMLEQAGEHYLILVQTHPPHTHSTVKRLGAQIKDAMLQQPGFRAHLGLAPIGLQTPSVASQDSPGSSASELNASPTRTANPPTPLHHPTSSVTTASTSTTLASDSLATQLHARYADQVQFILFNRCGQANCHGSTAKNPFRLESVAGMNSAENSRSNMESVLKYVSESPSARSMLIEYATQAHGGRRQPAIAERESHLLARIEQWIGFVQNPVVHAEAIGPSRPSGLGPSGLQPVAPDAPQYQVVPSPEELDELDALISQQVTFPPQSSSQDLFDPTEFNRQRDEQQRLRQSESLRSVSTN